MSPEYLQGQSEGWIKQQENGIGEYAVKGIVLAGGSGTRLYPITKGISKQLMPIYDKPMIYYPLATLIGAGINEIQIITTPHDQESFKNLLGDGADLGCRFDYKIQEEPRGLAEAFILSEDFVDGDDVTMILGDNIFFAAGLSKTIRSAFGREGMTVFASRVHDPERYGVVEFDDDMKVLSVEEKPEKPKSHYAIPGLYICDGRAAEFAKKVEPSERGEIEITGIQQQYLDLDQLYAAPFERGTVWFDTGTIDSMNEANNHVRGIEKNQDIKVGCIEEAAYRSGFIDVDQLHELAKPLIKSGYGKYLMNLEE